MKPKFTLFLVFAGCLLISDFALAQSADDYNLAARFAPLIYLSAPNSEGNPVDLQDNDYLFSDYHPMRVDDLLAPLPNPTIDLRLKNSVTVGPETYPAGDYPLTVPGYIDLLGAAGVRSADNSLLFDPLWDPDQSDEQLAFKQRAGDPAVYFRVFRDTDPDNPLSIAVQYWFFYFYNTWFQNHPGDWESVTVFLDENTNPREVIFSAFFEASKYTWNNELFEELRSQDHFAVFVSNGGHGSYGLPGETSYSGIGDRHEGDGGTLDYENGDYTLIDLGELENNPNSWIWYEGRWGNDGVNIDDGIDPAPRGPMFRKDAENAGDWFRANNRPYDPYNECKRRDYGADLYDPWYWASGYGLDTPWTSTEDCLDATLNVMAPDPVERAVFQDQVSLRWNPVPNASGYRILYGFSSGDYPYEFDTGGLTELGGSLEDGNYYLAIVAYNQFAESEPSQEVVLTVGQDGTPLAAPTILEVEVEDDRVTINWSSVFGASGYTAQYGPAPGQYDQTIDLGTSNGFSSDLAPGTYYFRIAGYDSVNEPGLYTEDIEVFVSAPLPAPESLSPGSTTPPVPVIAGTSLTLQWGAVQGATFYYVSVRDLTSSQSVVDQDNITSTSLDVSGLSPDHKYRWSVQACNSSTCSDSSARHYFDTD